MTSSNAVEPFSITGTLNRSMEIYIENARVFLILSALMLAIPVFLGIIELMAPDLAAGLTLLLIPVTVAWSVLIINALTLAAYYAERHESCSWQDMISQVYSKFWPLLGGALLYFALTLVGTVLFIIPGFYWMTIFFFFGFAILFEDQGPWSSFKASAALVRGRFWKLALYQGVAGLILIAVILPIYISLYLLGMPLMLANLVGKAATVLVVPLLTTFYYLLYVWLKQTQQGPATITIHETNVS